jgi:hypothetical protein
MARAICSLCSANSPPRNNISQPVAIWVPKAPAVGTSASWAEERYRGGKTPRPPPGWPHSSMALGGSAMALPCAFQHAAGWGEGSSRIFCSNGQDAVPSVRAFCGLCFAGQAQGQPQTLESVLPAVRVSGLAVATPGLEVAVPRG